MFTYVYKHFFPLRKTESQCSYHVFVYTKYHAWHFLMKLFLQVIVRTMFEILRAIESKSNFIVVVGPTGTGKRSAVMEACAMVIWKICCIHSHAILCHIMLCHVISCHIISYHVILCHIMFSHVMSCYVMSYHVISCYIM